MAIVSTAQFDSLLEHRFDAECYRAELQEVERRVAARAPRAMKEVAHVSDGNHVSIAGSFRDEGIRYLKGAEVSEVFIDDLDPTYIPRSVYDAIKRAHVSVGDVLLSVVGSVGPVALVTDKYKVLSCSCKLAILRPFGISAALLTAYLLSPTGQALLLRRNRGSVQQGVILPDLRTFPVPRFSTDVAKRVEKAIAEAAIQKRLGDKLYPEAEDELLDRIGWWKLLRTPPELSYVRTIEGCAALNRVDAEFFQPQYDRLRAALSKSKGGRPFAELVSRFDKGTQPEEYIESGAVTVVKAKQVTGRGLSLEKCERTGPDVWSDESARLGESDVVINSTGRGTLGRAAVIPQHSGKVVAAVDLVIPRIYREMVHPEYLALFLNSPAGIAQSEQHQTGSSGQLHLYPDQHFARFIIFLPRKENGEIDMAWQNSLAEKAEAAAKARAASRAFLNEAKRLVEESLF